MLKTFTTAGASRIALLAGAGIAAVAYTTPSYAQSSTGVTQACPDEDGDGVCDTSMTTADSTSAEILVTGTRIRNPNLEATEPATSIGQDYIDQRNFVNVADAINELPQIRGSVTPNGGQSAFGQGVNFVNIFGLGTNRTLTLINGRRVVSSNTPTLFGPGNPGIQVDLNIVPTALIDRLDIVSTAGAPVYGSDAIAGTINILLKEDYEGLQLNATSSITEEGDGFTYRLEGVAGASFADGRGHVQLSAFYTEVDGILNRERQIFLDEVETQNNTIDVNRVDPSLPLDTGADDGVPATVLFNGSRIFVLSNFGVIFGGPAGVTSAGSRLDGLSGTGAFQFDAQGNLVPFNVGTRPLNVARTAAVGLRGIGGEGFQFSDFGQLTSDLRRFGANVFANYDILDSVNLFVEGTYYDARADELVQQPTFNTPLFGGPSSALTFNINNPFLNDQARGILQSRGVTNFTISRANVGFADLTGYAETELLRGVIGARGDYTLFQDDWKWEASFTYGNADVADFRQDINVQNFVNATNVTRNAQGQIVCDPNPATPVQAAFRPVADARCVPFNFFGLQASPEAINYVISQNTTLSSLEQVVFNANTSGTLFRFNNNDISLSLGYEHRRESGEFNPSEFEQEGRGRGAAVTPISGSFNVDEVFGEIGAPIITPQNDSFIHSLGVFGRGRYVDNTVNGGFFSWAAGGYLAPIEDIEFRGNFTRSFRAPAITELFLPQSNFFAFVPDLCFGTAPTQGPNPEARQRNCQAFLAAFPNIPRPQTAAQASVPAITGGNPNLENEKADSWTVGGIIRPRFIPNFSLTVDYINISISDPIASLSAAQINSACFDNDIFDAADPANGNAFCSLIRRDATGEVISDAANPGVVTTFTNGNAIDFEGIQGEMLYQTGLSRFGLGGRLQMRGNLLVTLYRQIDITGVAPARSDGELGDPQFSGQFTLRYTEDNWNVGSTINYTGEQLFSRFSRDPDTRQFDQLEDFVTVDFNLGFRTDDEFRFNFVVRNLFDRRCQRVNSFCIPGTGINDAFGRTYSISATKDF